MKTKVALRIFLTIFVLSTLPMAASYFVLEDTLGRALRLGFSDDVSRLIERQQVLLKELRKVEPDRSAELRAEFEESRALGTVFQQGGEVREILNRTLRTYFAIAVLTVLLLSIAAAIHMGRNLVRTFSDTFADLARQRDRVKYLEDIALWQEIAQKLAHEIKNPLTPIELLVSGLQRDFEKSAPEAFRKNLKETCGIVRDEVGHLRRLVHHFAEFATLPQAQKTAIDLNSYLDQFVNSYASTWPEVRFYRMHSDSHSNGPLHAELDPGLFRQVLMNLINNATEENPGLSISFGLIITVEEDSIVLTLENSGRSILAGDHEKIFRPSFSSKRGPGNRGLGLTVVKKIVMDHGGQVTVLHREVGAAFQIELPILSVSPGAFV